MTAVWCERDVFAHSQNCQTQSHGRVLAAVDLMSDASDNMVNSSIPRLSRLSNLAFERVHGRAISTISVTDFASPSTGIRELLIEDSRGAMQCRMASRSMQGVRVENREEFIKRSS
jgi:hypothetical protein